MLVGANKQHNSSSSSVQVSFDTVGWVTEWASSL